MRETKGREGIKRRGGSWGEKKGDERRRRARRKIAAVFVAVWCINFLRLKLIAVAAWLKKKKTPQGSLSVSVRGMLHHDKWSV